MTANRVATTASKQRGGCLLLAVLVDGFAAMGQGHRIAVEVGKTQKRQCNKMPTSHVQHSELPSAAIGLYRDYSTSE